MLQMMSSYALALGYEEDRLLNGIWIGLLSVEALMVIGVTIHSVVRRFSAKPKLKAC